MALGNLKVTLNLVADQYLAGLNSAQREAQTFSNKFKPLQKTIGDFGGAMRSVGVGMTAAITLPLAAAGGLIVKTGIDFESAFAGVRKTVNATEPELAKIRDQFRDMAKEMPTTAVELAKIGEAAGQLGIQTNDIATFTKQMAMLGETTNLTSDEAATMTAQFQNIFGAAGKDVDRFASALVGLGNAGASTEKDILEMGVRIAGAGNLVGLSQAQVLGFASALSSVGINAELGGSAISRVFLKMNEAVLKGGENLAEFAAISGMTAVQFKESFEKDPAEAMLAFLEGLKGMGKGADAALEGVIGKSIGIKTTLMNAAGAASEVRSQVELGTKAWQDNTAAQAEYNKRLETTKAQLDILRNQLTDIGIELFEALKPVITETVIPGMRSLVGIIAELAEGFTALPKPVQAATIGILGLAAIVGPALAGLGFALQGIAGLIPVFTKITSLLAGWGGISGVIGSVTGAIGGMGTILASTAAGLTLMTGGVIALGAAIGILIGGLANWAIHALGLQPALDANLKSMVDMVPFIGKKITGQANVDEATAGLGMAQAGLVAQARSKGIEVDVARLNSDPLYLGSIAKQIKAQSGFKMGDKISLGGAVPPPKTGPRIPPPPKIDTESEKEGKREAERIKQQAEQFRDALRPADDWIKKLKELREVQGVLDRDILAVHGPAILEAAEAQRKHGFEIDATVHAMAKEQAFLNEIAELQKTVAAGWEKVTEKMEKHRAAIVAATPDIFGGKELDIKRDPETQARIDEMARRGGLTSGLKEQQKAIMTAADDWMRLASTGEYTTAQIEEMVGMSAGSVLERAKELGVVLPDLTRKTLDQIESVDVLGKSWGNSLGSMVDAAVDMIVDLDFSFKRLGDIAKNTAKDMARSFLDGFFKPFKDKMIGIGSDLADFVLGNKKKADGEEEGGGLFGGLLGGGGLLSGVFGGGGKEGGLLGGLFGGMKGTPGFAGGAGGAAAGAGMSSALGLASLGLGAVGMIGSALGKVGAGRDSANEIVKAQNAFVNQTLAGILGDSGLSSTNKLKLVRNEFEAFQANLGQYGASGGENAVTANQAFATVSPLVSRIQADLIKQGATEGGAGEGSVHNGDVVFNFQLPENVTNPEQWLDWWDKNKGGIRIRVAEGVFAMEGAIVTR